MVDIHSHILPEVDDGPKSWDVSVAMCRAAAADGITHMVATPHANDRYHYDRKYLKGLLDHLQQLAGDSPKLMLGCDFHLSVDNIQDAFANPSRYVIEDTRYLLVEFNNFSIPLRISDTFMQFRNLGITPIITHPERNPMLRKDLQRVLEWVEQDCVVQVTGSALTGSWGDDARGAALELFKHQAVHVLATDAHDTEKRVPILSSAREAATKICGKDVAEALVYGNPRAIINNQKMPLPYFPHPVMTKAKKY